MENRRVDIMADEKNLRRAAQAKPSSKILIGAALVLAALIVVAAYYWSMPAPAPKQAGPAANQTGAELLSQPGAVALIGALEKQKKVPESYVIGYFERDPIGQTDNITVEKSQYAAGAEIKNGVYTRSLYVGGGQITACLRLGRQNEKCADLQNNSGLRQAIGDMNKSLIFFGGNETAANTEAAKQLIGNAVIQFNESPKESEVAGRKCTEILYTYSPPIAAGQKIRIEKCADEEYGVFLSSNETKEVQIGADNKSINLTYSVIYTKFEPGANPSIVAPSTNAGEQETATAFEDMAAVMSDVRDCGWSINTKDAFNKCIFAAALNHDMVSLCKVSEGEDEADLCALRLAKTSGKPEYCEEAGAMKNDCYLEYAYATGDASYCSMADSADGKEKCLNALKGKNETISTGGSPANSTIPASG